MFSAEARPEAAKHAIATMDANLMFDLAISAGKVVIMSR